MPLVPALVCFGLGEEGAFLLQWGSLGAGPPDPGGNEVKKNHLMLIAMLAAGTATFLIALLRRRELASPTPYDRPRGGEREGDFELFIGS